MLIRFIDVISTIPIIVVNWKRWLGQIPANQGLARISGTLPMRQWLTKLKSVCAVGIPSCIDFRQKACADALEGSNKRTIIGLHQTPR
jgi:hypothetical protein